jgi:hypothetical protein
MHHERDAKRYSGDAVKAKRVAKNDISMTGMAATS